MKLPSVYGWMLGVFAWVAVSCVRDTGYARIVEHDERETEAVPFRFMYSNTDTLSMRDMALALRYTDGYGKDRLNLRVECLSPSRKRFADTVSLALFDHASRQFADRKAVAQYDLQRTILQRAVFSEYGVYHITFMPLGEIGGINAIGLKIITTTE